MIQCIKKLRGAYLDFVGEDLWGGLIRGKVWVSVQISNCSGAAGMYIIEEEIGSLKECRRTK